MRQQEDSLQGFLVVLTDKGIVPVGDPQQISVFNYLCAGRKRPLDISEDLGIPSSSLHFVLDKMVDSGIIVRSKPDPVKKEVFYSVQSRVLMSYNRPTGEVESDAEEMLKNPERYFTGLSGVSNMLDAYLAGLGLDHTYIRKRYVEDLADAVSDRIPKGNQDDTLTALKQVFNGLTGYRLSVFSTNPLTIVIEGNRSVRLKMDMLSDLVARMMFNSTGKFYGDANIEDFSNDDVYRYKVTYNRSSTEDAYINTSLPQQNDPEPFFILDLDGKASLLSGDIQTKIVEAVYDRPLCVSDITNVVDMPRSTVTTNILRMIEDGVIAAFYAENGSLYYGLNCSVLMKRVSKVLKDVSPIRAAVQGAVGSGFNEGYFHYMVAYLRGLGFDTEYIMISLGAKYMRAANDNSPKNFDAYFERIREVGGIVGIDLTVTSVYPLTIGISKDVQGEPGSMMNFAKGMVHQGLEMASRGMFLRVSEETDTEMRVSFKEIYPPISLTPPAGMFTDAADAAATEVKKKRTSSVRDALRNRSARLGGKPNRTMRHITGIAVAAIVIAAMALCFTGLNDVAYADTYSLNVDSEEITLYNVDGEEMILPYSWGVNATVSFGVDAGSIESVGIVRDGVAHPIESFQSGDGIYTVFLDRNTVITEIRQITIPDGISAKIYDFGNDVSERVAYEEGGYIPADIYEERAGGLWVSDDAWVKYTVPEGRYISVGTENHCYLDEVNSKAWGQAQMTSRIMPSNYVTVTLQGAYTVGGYYVTGELYVCGGANIDLKFLSTDGPVSITITEGGKSQSLMLSEDRMVTINVDQDAAISYVHVGIY